MYIFWTVGRSRSTQREPTGKTSLQKEAMLRFDSKAFLKQFNSATNFSTVQPSIGKVHFKAFNTTFQRGAIKREVCCISKTLISIPCCISAPTPNQTLLIRVKLFSTTSESGLQG